MRHLKLVGTLLILALAASGLASATASAANPEFLDNVIGNTFTGTSGEGELLDPVTKLAIKCKKDTLLLADNEVTGPKTVKAGVHFEGCTIGGLAANSLGDKSGIILVTATGTLCYINQPNKHVGVLLTITPVHIEIPTLAQLLEVKGTVLGLMTPVNELKTAGFKLVINKAIAKEKCENGVLDQLLLEQEHNKKPLAAEEVTTEEITFDKDIEVMA